MAAPAGAATINISSLPLGKIISLDGQKFIKTRHDFTKGSQFVALAPACLPDFFSPGEYNGFLLQNFSSHNCNCIPTPTATNYIFVGTMIDARDGKSYEIRKFADGKCWMVDNLMYGGGTDGSSDYCAGKSTFRNATSAANAGAVATNGLNPPDGSRNTLVGDCRDPRAAGNGAVAAPCTADSTTCGYYYNWPAVIQNSSGWFGNSYQPLEPTQGICPDGWHVPSGNTGGEFFTLDVANGGTGAHQSACTTASCNFWQPGNNFKGVFSGDCRDSCTLFSQGVNGNYWSSTQSTSDFAYYFYFTANNLHPGTYDRTKYYGRAVRCIKN